MQTCIYDLTHVNEIATVSLSTKSRTHPDVNWRGFVVYFIQLGSFANQMNFKSKLWRIDPTLFIHMIALSRQFLLRYMSWNKETWRSVRNVHSSRSEVSTVLNTEKKSTRLFAILRLNNINTKIPDYNLMAVYRYLNFTRRHQSN